MSAIMQAGARDLYAHSDAQRTLVFARFEEASSDFLCGAFPFACHPKWPSVARDALFSPDTVIEVKDGRPEVMLDPQKRLSSLLVLCQNGSVLERGPLLPGPVGLRREGAEALPPRHTISDRVLEAVSERGTGEPREACALEYDSEPLLALPLFTKAFLWVQAKASRRLTVARCVPLPAVALLETFARYTPQGQERAFLRLGGEVEYVGLSPELLAHGTTQRFFCDKLSGTASLDAADPLSDPRLIWEHESSILSMVGSLQSIGVVYRSAPRLMRLSALQHIASRLSCAPFSGASWRQCVGAVLPAGASPVEEGFAALQEIETTPRGPYYGLTGYVLPGGEFSFSQTLRTIFKRKDHCYTMVGAAVTPYSTPALELEETRVKLSSIRFVLG